MEDFPEPIEARDVETLREALAGGARAQYLLFWGHTPRQAGVADRACLSQWYPSPFVVDGLSYATAEHFMMAEKARLFDDGITLAKIHEASSPAEAKALGRSIGLYRDDYWEEKRFEIVVRGNLEKFGQDEGLRAFLLGTADRVLVEASPEDAIWGIGLAADDPDAERPEAWPGQNLLGFALMEVRARLT